MTRSTLVALFVCLSGTAVAQSPDPLGPETHEIAVSTDGTFTPEVSWVRPGDTVRWLFSESTDAVGAVAPSRRAGGPERCEDAGEASGRWAGLRDRRRASRGPERSANGAEAHDVDPSGHPPVSSPPVLERVRRARGCSG